MNFVNTPLDIKWYSPLDIKKICMLSIWIICLFSMFTKSGKLDFFCSSMVLGQSFVKFERIYWIVLGFDMKRMPLLFLLLLPPPPFPFLFPLFCSLCSTFPSSFFLPIPYSLSSWLSFPISLPFPLPSPSLPPFPISFSPLPLSYPLSPTFSFQPYLYVCIE